MNILSLWKKSWCAARLLPEWLSGWVAGVKISAIARSIWKNGRLILWHMANLLQVSNFDYASRIARALWICSKLQMESLQ